MDRPKIIIIDRDSTILDLLYFFLSMRNYEISIFRKPVFCPVYTNPGHLCTQGPCADALVMEYEVSGFDLLIRQAGQGCRIDKKRKAIISSDLIGDMRQRSSRTGCEFFEKPFRLADISRWLDSCMHPGSGM